MEFISALWIPILASAAAVWFVSALCWMAIGHHNKDALAIPNEREFIDAVKRLNIQPGNYGFPDFQKCKKLTKEQLKDWPGGPMGLLRVWGPIKMGQNMLLTFLTFLDACGITSPRVQPLQERASPGIPPNPAYGADRSGLWPASLASGPARPSRSARAASQRQRATV